MTAIRSATITLIALGISAAAPARPAALADAKAAALLPDQPQSVDLTLYYPTQATALAELEKVRGAEKALTPATEPSLDAYLDASDALLGRLRRLQAYFRLLKARDIDDQAANAATSVANTTTESIWTKANAALRAQTPGAA